MNSGVSFSATPGELRHRITIQKPVSTQDEFGQPTDSWDNVITLWAKVEDLSGREYFIAQQVPASQVNARITIRWRVGIKSEMRIVHGDRILNIKAVLDPDGRRKWLHLMCQEVSP